MGDIHEVITLVGRGHTDQQFTAEIFNLLYGGYKIFACHSLGEPGIDKKERFLVLITSTVDEPEFDYDTQVERLTNATEPYGVKLFDSLDEALEYSAGEYNLSIEKIQAHSNYQELIEQFPQLSAQESEQWLVLDAFIRLGRVTVVPAQLDDARAVAIVSVTHGPDEMRITPLAILATEEIVENLKLPGAE